MNPFQIDTIPQFVLSTFSTGRFRQIMNTTTVTHRPDRTVKRSHPEQADRPTSGRIHWNWLAVWALLTTFALFEVVKHGFVNGTLLDAAMLSAVAFGCFVAPDLTFLIGIGEPVPHGNLARRAVPWYNRMHRMWFPFALTSLIGIVLAPLAFVPLAMFIGGLSWMAHIALDRSAGYGLRNADGSRDRS